MKTLGKAIAAASLAAISVNATAVEGLSTTLGAVSDYYFRGANLGDAGAYASVDYEVGGFYAGVWIIDDAMGGNDGLETDFYLGYGIDLDGIELGIAYNRYEYTYDTGGQVNPLGTGDDVDTSGQYEQEFVLSAATAGFGLELAFGTAEADHVVTTAGDLTVGDQLETEQDYTYIAVSYENGPYGVLLGSMDKDNVEASGAASGEIDGTDSEYMHIEFSYAQEIGTFDTSVTVGQQFNIENGGEDGTSQGNNYLIFDVSKSFDL